MHQQEPTKLTAIVESQYQLQNMANIRALGVRFLTRRILVSHQTSKKKTP